MIRLARPLVLSALLVTALALPAAAPAAVTEELDVGYGSAVDFDGERQRLALDLYRPEPRKRPRPAIVWVHGGGFTFGSRTFMTPHAKLMAERGYVSATITYRLADNGELAQVGYARAVEAAQHDAQAAVRWLRRHAKRLNVDPRRIYIGGHSAGAITALEVGVSRRDPGQSGNPGYSSRVGGAIAIAGLIFDHTQIDRRDAPMLLFHGDADRHGALRGVNPRVRVGPDGAPALSSRGLPGRRPLRGLLQDHGDHRDHGPLAAAAVVTVRT